MHACLLEKRRGLTDQASVIVSDVGHISRTAAYLRHSQLQENDLCMEHDGLSGTSEVCLWSCGVRAMMKLDSEGLRELVGLFKNAPLLV